MKRIILSFALLVTTLIFTGASCFSLTQEEEYTTSGPAGMFVSTDKGDTWQQISALPAPEGVGSLAGSSVFNIFEDPQDPKAMYWGSRGDGLFYSYNEGRGWIRSGSPLSNGFIYSVTVDSKNKCTIFATNGSYVYKSVDCNRSWETVYHEEQSNARISTLLAYPNGSGKIFMTKVNGDLLVSEDGGTSWTVTNRFKTRIGWIDADAVNPGVLYLASHTNGLYVTENDGKNWRREKESLEEYSKALDYRRLYVHPTKADTLYWISTYGILKSTDRGKSWKPYKLITSPGSVDIFAFAINPDNDKEMYYTATLKSRSTLYRTSDDGSTWSTKKLPTGQIPIVLRVHPENGNILYAGFTLPTQ